MAVRKIAHEFMALLEGDTVNHKGMHSRMAPGDIAPGDTYLAEHNTGPHVLTAARIDQELGCIYPVEPGAYPYEVLGRISHTPRA